MIRLVYLSRFVKMVMSAAILPLLQGLVKVLHYQPLLTNTGQEEIRILSPDSRSHPFHRFFLFPLDILAGMAILSLKASRTPTVWRVVPQGI